MDKFESLGSLIESLARSFEANNETRLTKVMETMAELLEIVKELDVELTTHRCWLNDHDLAVNNLVSKTDDLHGTVDRLSFDEGRKNN